MEPSTYIEIHQTVSVTEKEDITCDLRSSEVAQEPDSGIISVHLLEFKTSLLEAVEELHIHRDAEKRYEAQICALVLEKQELEWQKESLQNQIDRMTNEHSESIAAVKKQFQAQVRGIEGEKGKHQLTAELKDKEIISLKEELKLLQLFKYSLEKKLSDLEQKLQLQTQAKDRHLNQLGEVEKRFSTITRQCAMVKQAHEKLEQNVEEAMRLNKTLTFINKKQDSTIAALKQDVERLNSEMVKYKVVSICRSGEESSNFLLKEQHLQELKRRLIVETELNKKLRNENAAEREETQKLISSLQHAQGLLQTQIQAVCRTEQQLSIHTEEYQVLKREHEMIQERSKEKEDRLMCVIEDYKKSKLSLEKEIQMLQAKMEADQKELKSVKEAYHQLSSCAVHQAKNMHGSENGFNIQKDSPSNLNCDVHLNLTGILCKDASLDPEVGQVSSQNDCEQMRHCKEVEDIPDERTVECQEVAKDDCFHGENGEVNVCSQMDRTALLLPPSHSLDALAPDQSERSENISGADVLVTHLHIHPVVKQEASVIKSTCDNGCPSSVEQSYTDICLARLSEPETRSVYAVASDPLMSESRDRPGEQSLGVSEMRERQTSDKHTSKTSQEGDLKEVEQPTTAPDTNNPQSVLLNNGKLSTDGPMLLEESETNPTLQNKDMLNNYMKKHKQLDAPDSGPTQQISTSHGEKTLPWAASFSDTTLRALDSQLSQPQGASLSRYGSLMHQESLKTISKNIEVTETNSTPKAELKAIASHLSPFSQRTVDIPVNLSEAPQGNEDNVAAAISAQIVKEQENADAFSSPLLSNMRENALSIDIFTKQGDTVNDEKQSLDNEPSYLEDSEKDRLSFNPCMLQKETTHTPCSQSTTSVCPVKNQNKSLSSRSLILEQKSALPSGFQELLSTLNTPLFSKHKFSNRGASVITQPFDKLNVSSIHPDRKSDHGEWHAIKQTFSEISVERENRVPISFGSAQLGSPAAQSMGNGLRHDCTPTPPFRLHGLGKVSQPVSEESTPTPLEKVDHHQSDIRAQIAKIEQFLSSEGFIPQKRRRLEKCEVSKP